MKWKHKKEIEEKFINFEPNLIKLKDCSLLNQRILLEMGIRLYWYYHIFEMGDRDQLNNFLFDGTNKKYNNISYRILNSMDVIPIPINPNYPKQTYYLSISIILEGYSNIILYYNKFIVL